MSQTPRENQEAIQEVTVGQIHRVMMENFEKINNALALVIKSNSLILGNLILLLEGRNAQDIGHDVVQEHLQAIDQKELMPKPSASSLPSTSTMAEATGSSRKATVPTKMTCADCGKTFIRGSCADSITKHGKSTACRPYGCSYCPKLFKKVSD